MKAAVYSGTRNLYPDMVTAAKTLVKYSSVDKIYFLTEDDRFPAVFPTEMCKYQDAVFVHEFAACVLHENSSRKCR